MELHPGVLTGEITTLACYSECEIAVSPPAPTRKTEAAVGVVYGGVLVLLIGESVGVRVVMYLKAM